MEKEAGKSTNHDRASAGRKTKCRHEGGFSGQAGAWLRERKDGPGLQRGENRKRREGRRSRRADVGSTDARNPRAGAGAGSGRGRARLLDQKDSPDSARRRGRALVWDRKTGPGSRPAGMRGPRNIRAPFTITAAFRLFEPRDGLGAGPAEFARSSWFFHGFFPTPMRHIVAPEW